MRDVRLFFSHVRDELWRRGAGVRRTGWPEPILLKAGPGLALAGDAACGFASAAQQTGDEEQRDGVEEDGCGGESHVLVAQVFEEEFAGDEGQAGPGEPDEFAALPAGTAAGEGKRGGATDEAADDGDVLGSWGCSGCGEAEEDPDCDPDEERRGGCYSQAGEEEAEERVPSFYETGMRRTGMGQGGIAENC